MFSSLATLFIVCQLLAFGLSYGLFSENRLEKVGQNVADVDESDEPLGADAGDVARERFNLRTLSIINAKSTIGRLVLLVCIKQCVRQRTQVESM